MIEQADHRRALIETIAKYGVHQYRIGLNVQRAQDRKQERRLALTIAETSRPGSCRIRRNPSARTHLQCHVTDAILDQRQR
ncbi:MAG: hypothetical protein ACREH4_04125, partial [Vitreimonas sp.]